MYGGIWTSPQSDKACFLCVLYVQQASKHLPNIQGGSKHMGVSKHTGEYPNIWGHPNIHEAVKTYIGCQNIWRHPNILVGIQTYWNIQAYGASKHRGGPSKYMGHPNIQGASKHMGASKCVGYIDTSLV